MERLWSVLACCLAFMAWPAQAQTSPALSKLEISVWPEYDRPEVLVIYRGRFAANSPLPVTVEIRIPARVGQPHAVAWVTDEGQQFNQKYATHIEGDRLVVSFELLSGSFQLEYYDLLPTDENGQRSYTFTYVADYPIAALSLDFQMPATAEGFLLAPAAPLAVQEADGLLYHLVEAGALDQGEARSWTLTYRKADSSLTVEVLASTPTPGTGAIAREPAHPSGWLLLIPFVALVAGMAAFWLARQTRLTCGPAGQTWPQGADRALFCHHCGVQLRPDSSFCHQCGTPVRKM